MSHSIARNVSGPLDSRFESETTSKDDYVSFPTIPNPELDNTRSISTIITKTLRRVTNNASTLVHTYSAPRRDDDLQDLQHALPLYAESDHGIASSSHSERRSVTSATPTVVKLTARQGNGVSDSATAMASSAPPTLEPQKSEISTATGVTRVEGPATLSRRTTLENVALPNTRVIADNRSLTLSNINLSKQPALLIDTKEVTVTGSDNQKKAGTSQSSTEENVSHDASPQTDTVQQSLNRILTLFNNLPNDIELSDDSASDLETINNDSLQSVAPSNASKNITEVARSPSFRKRAQQSPRRKSRSPSVSTFQILRNKGQMTRKISSNFGSTILDNAKNIIHSNLSGTEPERKKKRKRPAKLSDNPLKNGGISKKYWMNDTFVSDCLNCFKPFGAFRRKHHCRFCGQIFCSLCTLFISYSEYKEQTRRRKGIVGPSESSKSYTDKLRVCKPCYSDVIVYLSDTLSSESEEEKDIQLTTSSSDDVPTSMNGSFLARHRSYSVGSQRNSSFGESSALKSAAKQSLDMKYSPSAANSTNKSPEGVKHKFAPQMAIPTTRKGEAVEIPAPRNNGTENSPRNLAAIGLSSSFSGHPSPLKPYQSWFSHGHGPNGALHDPKDLTAHSSFENLGLLYKAVVRSRYERAVSNESPVIRNPTSLRNTEIEGESENEDEQVMSLYTSLHHNTIHPAIAKATLSPRPHLSNVSTVPTLLEFPIMGSDNKYIPSNSDQESAMQNFDFKPLDSIYQNSFNENKMRSDRRSHERARASLRRMRDRRIHRLAKKLAGPYLAPIKTDLESNMEEGSPSSVPTSPTPKFRLYSFGNKPQRTLSNPGVLAKEGRIATPEFSDVHDSTTQKTLHSVTNYDSDPEKSPAVFGTDNDLNDYFGSFKVSSKERFDWRIRSLFCQCLEDCDITDSTTQKRWIESLLIKLSKVHNLSTIDTLDIKQYVKMKKITGGTIENTMVMDGLFITKNIDLKSMTSKIQEPKIALLVFPIEYLKHKEQFISLRIVKSQQEVYIGNLVSRLISLEPDLVVVSDTVCGYAEKLLEEAGITVISNVKPQVIERILRYSGGDIFQSVNELFFKKGVLGTCAEFEIRKFVFEDVVKTYAFFEGTNPEAGFTVCLRGGGEEYLSSAKYAAESTIPGIFSAKFEVSFLEDLQLTIEPIASTGCQNQIETFQANFAALEDDSTTKLLIERTGILSYLERFNGRLLTTSPTINVTLPTPLKNVLNALEEFRKQKTLHDRVHSDSLTEEDFKDLARELQFEVEVKRFPSFESSKGALRLTSANILKRAANNLSYRARTWGNCMKFATYQLYPIFHKSLNLLHSSVSIKHATPCYGPVQVVIDYFTDNDKCLGQFFDQALQDTNRICDDCGELMIDHYKTYVHGNAKIDLIVEKLGSGSRDDKTQTEERNMWSFCSVCEMLTPVVPMSADTYFLSLGKFFELCFYSDKLCTPYCPHDYFEHHLKLFSFQDYIIRLEQRPIDTFEVVVPRKRLEFMIQTDIMLKLEVFESTNAASKAFFESVWKRLNRVNLDSFEKEKAGHEKLEELKQRLHDEELLISERISHVNESTSPANYLAFNIIQREIQELGVVWDKEFSDFENAFFLSENEINRITQFHLRNFLLDKIDVPKDKDVNIFSDLLEPFEQRISESESSNCDQGEQASSRPITPRNSLPKPPLGPRLRVPLTLIEDKIIQYQQSLENGEVGSLQKSPYRQQQEKKQIPVIRQPTNKVQDLTKYFNQMTLEFKRQRERALESRYDNFKAIPVINSQPVAEIYDNIEDVVDVNERVKDERGARSEVTGNGLLNSGHREESLSDGPTLGSLSKTDLPPVEKNSILKSLTNFWADRSATSWEPLVYPLESNEHTFADSDVIVREDEPSSLVAFCLSSKDYKQKIVDMTTNHEDEADHARSNEYKQKLANFQKLERKFKKRVEEGAEEISELESIMHKDKTNHLKYQFNDGDTNLSCKIFYSEQFEAFRKACAVDESFIQSLSRCVKWNSKGGKSGSNFLKTLDNRYILKELSKSELESFVSIAPFYFRYISQSTFNNLTTAIAKIFGFYQVEIKNSSTGKTFRMDFLIMENLFYNRKTTRIFDLKGSMRNRHVKQTGKENEVLLDENMIEYIYESPVFVKEQLKKLLRGSLFNDTSFLSAMDVMDYSLVIGIDDTSNKLYVGIIDWLRTFTWDKKVENWVKGSSLVARKGKDPTIVTPKQYRTRFREAMERYILEVPDVWYEGNF